MGQRPADDLCFDEAIGWDVDDMCDWLERVNIREAQSYFRENRIDGKALMMTGGKSAAIAPKIKKLNREKKEKLSRYLTNFDEQLAARSSGKAPVGQQLRSTMQRLSTAVAPTPSRGITADLPALPVRDMPSARPALPVRGANTKCLTVSPKREFPPAVPAVPDEEESLYVSDENVDDFTDDEEEYENCDDVCTNDLPPPPVSRREQPNKLTPAPPSPIQSDDEQYVCVPNNEDDELYEAPIESPAQCPTRGPGTRAQLPVGGNVNKVKQSAELSDDVYEAPSDDRPAPVPPRGPGNRQCPPVPIPDNKTTDEDMYEATQFDEPPANLPSRSARASPPVKSHLNKTKQPAEDEETYEAPSINEPPAPLPSRNPGARPTPPVPSNVNKTKQFTEDDELYEPPSSNEPPAQLPSRNQGGRLPPPVAKDDELYEPPPFNESPAPPSSRNIGAKAPPPVPGHVNKTKQPVEESSAVVSSPPPRKPASIPQVSVGNWNGNNGDSDRATAVPHVGRGGRGAVILTCGLETLNAAKQRLRPRLPPGDNNRQLDDKPDELQQQTNKLQQTASPATDRRQAVPLPANTQPEVRPVQNSDPLAGEPWFYANIKREEAIRIVSERRQNGAFLVRPSETGGDTKPYTLCLFHEGETFNIQIRRRSDNLFALGNQKPRENAFQSVSEMVSFHRNNAIEVSKKNRPLGYVKLCAAK